MRFDIKAGGALLILVGLAVLSGAVFALGLVAGYEMARQNQADTSTLASVFPAPSPVAALSPSAGATPAAAAMNVPPAPPAGGSPGEPTQAAPRTSGPAGVSRAVAPVLPPSPAVAALPPPPPPSPSENAPPSEEASVFSGEVPASGAEPSGSETAAAPGTTAGTGNVASASTPAAPKRRPYNIQIDAAMDESGAREMAARLRKLGYQATIVQTPIAGQTWYRVRVGPYWSEEDAQAAQERLRQQYQAAFGPHPAGQ